ncbi:MAG: DUF1573 domain-containing protein [Planctomycetota bacterium]
MNVSPSFKSRLIRLGLVVPLTLLAAPLSAAAPQEPAPVPVKQKEQPAPKPVPKPMPKPVPQGEKEKEGDTGKLDPKEQEQLKRRQEEIARKQKEKEIEEAKRRGDGKLPPRGDAPPAKRVPTGDVDGRKGLREGDMTDEEKAKLDQRRQQELIQSDPGAKLDMVFGSERHDFGRLRQGDLVSHSFDLQAGGTTPLKIRQVKPSCGCTLGSVEVADAEGNFGPYNYGDPIDPGRPIRINASVDTANKKNKVQVRIQIMSNDPAGVHALTLAADVQPLLVSTPAMINFGDVQLGSINEQTVDIRTSLGEPIGLSIDQQRVNNLPVGMSYELSPVGPNAEGKSSHWQLRVKLGAEALEGQANATLRVISDLPMPVDPKKEQEAIERGSHIVPQYFNTSVSISARVLGVFSVDRPYLSFGLFRPGQVVPRQLRLTCNQDGYTLDKVTVELRGRGVRSSPRPSTSPPASVRFPARTRSTSSCA